MFARLFKIQIKYTTLYKTLQSFIQRQTILHNFTKRYTSQQSSPIQYTTSQYVYNTLQHFYTTVQHCKQLHNTFTQLSKQQIKHNFTLQQNFLQVLNERHKVLNNFAQPYTTLHNFTTLQRTCTFVLRLYYTVESELYTFSESFTTIHTTLQNFTHLNKTLHNFTHLFTTIQNHTKLYNNFTPLYTSRHNSSKLDKIQHKTYTTQKLYKSLQNITNIYIYIHIYKTLNNFPNYTKLYNTLP